MQHSQLRKQDWNYPFHVEFYNSISLPNHPLWKWNFHSLVWPAWLARPAQPSWPTGRAAQVQYMLDCNQMGYRKLSTFMGVKRQTYNQSETLWSQSFFEFAFKHLKGLSLKIKPATSISNYGHKLATLRYVKYLVKLKLYKNSNVISYFYNPTPLWGTDPLHTEVSTSYIWYFDATMCLLDMHR